MHDGQAFQGTFVQPARRSVRYGTQLYPELNFNKFAVGLIEIRKSIQQFSERSSVPLIVVDVRTAVSGTSMVVSAFLLIEWCVRFNSSLLIATAAEIFATMPDMCQCDLSDTRKYGQYVFSTVEDGLLKILNNVRWYASAIYSGSAKYSFENKAMNDKFY